MRCFVIRGFGKKKDSEGQVIDFERVHRELIAEAIKECNLKGDTTAEVLDAGSIHEDMFQLILQADIVICDITVHNANVFYELGVRHALRKKHTVLIKGNPSADVTPFDIAGGRYMPYPVDNPGAALGDLVAAIRAGLAGARETDSPILLTLPKLPEADVSSVDVLHLSFIEEVQLAAARSDKGWLRLLADDVMGERFERQGLKAIGRAQWKNAKDYEAAIATWEIVRGAAPYDLDANLALANLYERQFKQTGEATLLERSNLAIERVLARKPLPPTDRAEALALKGRNLKTLWRLAFSKLDTPEQRRARAIDVKAKLSYEAYRDAYKTDLNSFFPGIAAFQMGCILQSLAQSPGFANLFTHDRQRAAKQYVGVLKRDLAALQHVVRASIERAFTDGNDDDRVWAAISAADLVFLTEPLSVLQADPAIAAEAYRNAVPLGSFYWDAAKGQLELFAQLGIRADVAQAVITALDGPAAGVQSGRRHLVVFSGHTVDKANAPQPRFPSAAQQRARSLIEDALRGMKREDERITMLASAAPGADILALESCKPLGIETWLCLPMSRNAVADEVFKQYEDDWRNRFFDLVDAQSQERTYLMHSAAGLPRWLSARGMTPWSRGNRWMLRQAQAWGADRVTLLALWDRNELDPSTDGTAEMVRLARKAGMFLEIIDCGQLAGPAA
ncbi:tetratricopeptide repeat-containing protein [Variovorax sp. dw_308]|uniref:tetratricopeptide repeat-containing protein n=1 Tax=Variovorax sp. dw_308 TaxID=2721546 RepID=UPI001C457046|nr:tetratricopeptide repeat-containing protein [Variovorax sp. dw_308]